jgi:hypothetical protein
MRFLAGEMVREMHPLVRLGAPSTHDDSNERASKRASLSLLGSRDA